MCGMGSTMAVDDYSSTRSPLDDIPRPLDFEGPSLPSLTPEMSPKASDSGQNLRDRENDHPLPQLTSTTRVTTQQSEPLSEGSRMPNHAYGNEQEGIIVSRSGKRGPVASSPQPGSKKRRSGRSYSVGSKGQPDILSAEDFKGEDRYAKQHEMVQGPITHMSSEDHSATSEQIMVQIFSGLTQVEKCVAELQIMIKNELLEKENKKLKQNIEKLQAQHETQSTQLSEALEEKRTYERIVGSVPQAFEKTALLQEIRQLHGKLNASLEEGVSKDEDDRSLKVSDSSIGGLRDQMAYNVRNLVDTVLTVRPDGKVFFPHIENKAAIVALAKECKEKPNYSSLVLERHIWLAITKLFQLKDGIWSGKLGEKLALSFRQLQSEWHHFSCIPLIPRNATELNHICVGEAAGDPQCLAIISRAKARAAQDLDRAYGSNNQALRGVSDTTSRDLFVFANNGQRLELQQAMFRIMDQALQLRIIFLQSRAFFNVNQIGNGPTSEWADTWGPRIKEAPSIIEVDFVLRPYLLKTGTADGDRFEFKQVLRKGLVVPARPLAPAATSTPSLSPAPSSVESLDPVTARTRVRRRANQRSSTEEADADFAPDPRDK